MAGSTNGEIDRRIAEAALAAEATIARVRLVASVLLAGAFAVAVLGARFAPEEAPPAWALTTGLAVSLAYAAIAFAILRLSAPRHFRPWMSFLFVTLDALLLAAALVVALVNTSLPGSAVPLFPVVWIAPLILAFGTLRYDARVQAYALAVTLTALVLPSLLLGTEASLSAITPADLNFLGTRPAIVRVLMLLLAGLVLVIAVRRSRALLARALADRVARDNLTRFLPPQIGEVLVSNPSDVLRRGRRQRAAILFIDVRGFTRRAETMAPEAIGPFLAEFRRRVTQEVESRGGMIDKFLGDGALAVFGVPAERGDEPARALEAARAIVASIAVWRPSGLQAGDSIAVGVGANWGEVFVGAVGDAERLEFTVLGDTVNVAARLQELTKEHGVAILATAAMVAAAGEADDARWLALAHQILRGRDAPIDLRCWRPA